MPFGDEPLEFQVICSCFYFILFFVWPCLERHVLLTVVHRKVCHPCFFVCDFCFGVSLVSPSSVALLSVFLFSPSFFFFLLLLPWLQFSFSTLFLCFWILRVGFLSVVDGWGRSVFAVRFIPMFDRYLQVLNNIIFLYVVLNP